MKEKILTTKQAALNDEIRQEQIIGMLESIVPSEELPPPPADMDVEFPILLKRGGPTTTKTFIDQYLQEKKLQVIIYLFINSLHINCLYIYNLFFLWI